MGIPDLKAREQILKVLCKNLKTSPNFSYEELAKNTPGYVGADLLALTREAAMAAINRAFGTLQRSDKDKPKKIKEVEKVNDKAPSLSETKINSEDAMEVDVTGDGKSTEEENVVIEEDKKEEKKDESENKSPEEKITEKTNDVEVQKIDEGNASENVENKPAEGDAKKEEEKKDKKEDSDMDTAETISEESIQIKETEKEIEVCKDKSAETDEVSI